MSKLRNIVRQVKPVLERRSIDYVDRVQTLLTEAYNIPLASEKDIDAFDFVGDKKHLKKLFKYVKPLSKPTSSTNVPLVGGAGNDGGNI